MKSRPRWRPPKVVVDLMVFAGMAMMAFAIPIGIELGWMAFHTPYADLKSAVVFGTVMALVCFVLGIVFYRVFGWFSKRSHELKRAIVKSTTQNLVNELVREHYESIVQNCNKCHLSIEQLRSIMHSYSKLPVKLNAGVYEKIEIEYILIEGVPKWSVKAFLWTENERKVDLTLKLTVAVDKDQPVVDVYDLYPS